MNESQFTPERGRPMWWLIIVILLLFLGLLVYTKWAEMKLGELRKERGHYVTMATRYDYRIPNFSCKAAIDPDYQLLYSKKEAKYVIKYGMHYLCLVDFEYFFMNPNMRMPTSFVDSCDAKKALWEYLNKINE